MTQTDQRATLKAIARRAMIEQGLEPDFSAQASADAAHLTAAPTAGLRDLRDLPWSSIDNDDSRDLDQIEVCVAPDGGRTRLLIGIADVDALVPPGCAVDAHARANTTSVYTAAEIFPMLPEQLSTDRTSLNQDQDRAAIVVDMTLDETGAIVASDVYRAAVRNRAQLAYSSVAAWLDGKGPAPARVGAVPGLDVQLRLQDKLATLLRGRREAVGALDFDRTEVKPILEGDKVTELHTEEPNRGRDLIENFMVAANGVTARFLTSHGFASIRRVVKSPERWSRIVDLAAQYGAKLPPEPDAPALAGFLRARRTAAPQGFGDLSLSIIKLMGRGEYVADAPETGSSHFALAVSNYTHSTAPNRRYPDIVTERLLKAAIAKQAAPYSLPELTALADHCTKQEDAANKVERLVRKAAAALWPSDRIGQEFDAIVTAASDKGTWVRLGKPPVEGKLEGRVEGLDVGDPLRVRLVSTDPARGFIDFVRIPGKPSGSP